MSEREVVEAIRRHVQGLDDGWRFVMGREAMGKELFLQKLERDREFRREIVRLVYELSIEILTGKRVG